MSVVGRVLPEPAPLAPRGQRLQHAGKESGKLKSPLAGKGEELYLSCTKCLRWLKGGCILLTVLAEKELVQPQLQQGPLS